MPRPPIPTWFFALVVVRLGHKGPVLGAGFFVAAAGLASGEELPGAHGDGGHDATRRMCGLRCGNHSRTVSGLTGRPVEACRSRAMVAHESPRCHAVET